MDRRMSCISILLLLFVLAVPLQVFAGPGNALPAVGQTWYANSPQGTYTSNLVTFITGTAIQKFVDSLPGLGLPGCTVDLVTPALNTCNANNLGQYIPIAEPIADGRYPGSDYYVIGLKDYRQQMHTNIPGTTDVLGTGTKLRGYYQINATDPKLQTPHYLGPLILAQRDKPVRILFQNMLGPSNGTGQLFIPVDPTLMGAGTGPLGGIELFPENRAVIHLHGGHTPWISDGTPHQWITPALDPTNYKKGLSFQNVPDMVGLGKSIPVPALNDGMGSYYYTNAQSGRLMFYHDHVHGLTRLNVYAGGAAGYLITDPAEEAMITAGNLPNICAGGGAAVCEYRYGIPLVIQDKTFVPANIAQQDDKWTNPAWGVQGDLWFPHVYEPGQSLTDPTGLNPMGRWDYGPWVWPPSPVTNPVLPVVSTVPEAFMDTPIVNGTAYPFVNVEAKAYRFRMLNAANDRSFNLQLYYGATAANVVCNDGLTAAASCTEVKMVAAADGRPGGVPDPLTAGPQMIQIGTESGFLPAPVTLPNLPIGFDDVGNILDKTLLLMPAERADVLIDFTGVPVGSTIILYNDAPAALPGGDPRYDLYTGNPDLTLNGGPFTTQAGFGPNTRTIMQFRITAAAAPITTVPVGMPAALTAAYTASQPAHIVPAGQYARLLDTAMTINARSIPFMGKSINEGFDPIYGRINAMLGTQSPDGLTAPVPLDYIMPTTETVANQNVQLWKIIHNGVDSHPMHFHLTDVQVVNRVGWDGSIRPPDPAELGWKETVRMNPQEDIIVAMRPKAPVVPFALPVSVRPLDVTIPVNAVTNPMTNFGYEYVWHCHILGHEEFDLMRPLVLNPNAVTELLFRNSVNGALAVWYMNGATDTGSANMGTAQAPWTIVGSGDFNGDGKRDLVLRNTVNGSVAIWYMDGTVRTGMATVGSLPAPWTVVGVGDFNADGQLDILASNTANGSSAVWLMNGAVRASTVTTSGPSASWRVVGTGDFNQDGKPDLLFRHTGTGQNSVWYMNGVVQSGSANLLTLAGAQWTVAGIGDFNGDVKPDILWRNTTTGENVVWYMNDVTRTGTAVVRTAATNWQILVGKQ